jgi:5'-3' exonuclease
MIDNIYVLDAGCYIHKAIFSFQGNLSKTDTWLESASITFLRMIIGDLNKTKFNPEDSIIILAQDGGRSWRKDFSDTYKATRKKKREQLEDGDWWKIMYKEMDDVITMVDNSLPIYCLKLPRIEADDIASVCCRYFKDKSIILYSFDADWEQLCYYDRTRLFSPKSKKFKIVKDPIGVLQKKIDSGDVSDEIKGKPKSESERIIREKIISLLKLPIEIELPIIEALDNIKPKSLQLSKFIAPPRVKRSLVKLFGL